MVREVPADPSRSARPAPLDALRARRAADYPPDPLPDILPGGGISLIAGASGIGKTAFLAWWATRFRDRLPLFGYPPHPVPQQAILAIDRSWVQSTSKWFEAVGFSDIPAYSPPDDPQVKPSQWRNKANRIYLLGQFLDTLEQQIGGLQPGALVYVDPLAPFLGGNLLDYDSCSVACMEIRELCRRRQITIIGTTHTAKLKADKQDRYARLQDRILGSTALLGYTDTQMYLAGPQETDKGLYAFLWNPHHAPQNTFWLDRDPQTGLFIPAGDKPRGEEQQAILTFLGQQPDLTARFVALHAAIPVSKSSLHYHLQELTRDGLIRQAGRGIYQLIPTH